ncbi:putative ribonuclease H-like domain-containing protein [Tanacetum coccineum]
MQEELLQFKIQKVWVLVNLPYGKKAIGTKWVYRNRKDEKGMVVMNKARLVAQGYRQEKGIDYDEVLAHVARIVAISIFLAFASFMGFIVYQIDVKSAFLYDTIEKEVYMFQPPGFVDPKFPNKSGYRRGTFDKTLFIKKDKKDIMLVKQKEDGIFLSQDKYVAEILTKFDFENVKTASTPIETQKPLVKDEEAADVDVPSYSKDFTPKCCEKDIKDVVNFLAMQEIDYYGYLYHCGRVLKIHTEDNVADLLTKAFDGPDLTFWWKSMDLKLDGSCDDDDISYIWLYLSLSVKGGKTLGFIVVFPSIHGLYMNVDPHEFSHV